MSRVAVTRAQRLGHTPPSTARVVGEIAVLSVILGVVMGVLWWMLAPDVVGVVVDGELAVNAEEGRKLFDRDAIFAILAAGCGLVMAVACAVRHSRRPVTCLVALVGFGLAGSVLATLIGGVLGPDGDVQGLADGAEHLLPLQMESRAGLIVWSMVATVVVAIVAVFREDQASWSVPGSPVQQ